MRKVILCIAVLVLLVGPLAAEAHPNRFVVQGPLYWHPFFYPGPFVYGYPGGFAYAYPGPYVETTSTGPYTYGLSRALRLRHVDLFPSPLLRQAGRVLDLKLTLH